MSTFAVTYIYSDDTAALDEHRPEHKQFLADLHTAGTLRVSGPCDGGTAALLVLEGDSAEHIAALLDGDPFARRGLIAERTIRDWTIVFGGVA